MQGYQKVLTFLIFLFICISEISFSQENEFGIKLKNFEITFSGTASFNKSQIEILIKTGTTDYLDLTELSDDILRIKKFYFDKGYFDTEVDTSLSINYKSKSASVIINIKECKPYRINKVNIYGLDHISDNISKLLFSPNQTFIKTGEIYSRDGVSLEIFRLISILNNNGYANAYFEPPEIIKIISTNPGSGNSVNVNINIKPGIQFKINKISLFINNNSHNISTFDFYRALDIHENEFYSKEKIIFSENKLNRISIVDYARIQIGGLDTNQNKMDLSININLKDKYEIKPQIFGYDIGNRFYGGIGLSFSDWYFFGGGRSQTTGAKVLYHSLDVHAYELNFQLYQPYIFNNYNIRGNWELKTSFFSEEIFKISTIKNTFQVFYELPNYTYINNLGLNWKISNERFNLKSAYSVITNDTTVTIPVNILINVFSSVLGFSILHNNSNDILFPTSGDIQTIGIEESGALGNLLKKLFNISTFGYIKLTSLNKIYINLSGSPSKAVLAGKFLIGSIFEYGDNRLKIGDQIVDVNIVPLEAKYIAGGSTSVRGWEAKKLGTFSGKENGGNFILEGSIEHRTRPFIESKGFFRDVGFVTFFDFGNLWAAPKYFRIGDIALAIGAGVRYYTIVGPVRFDIGFKLYDYDPGVGINKWLFQNNFNTIFKNQIAFQIGIGNTF
ncbi:MAG TPA: BamA/TamA family outer membrane protein [Ignavibacteria bacterium]